ncbi:hypothetical protein TNCV_1670811 [Trichonephila clavipes]|nr:hypothetical protein TNCV_1670811 [Trichonephila clavipes]
MTDMQMINFSTDLDKACAGSDTCSRIVVYRDGGLLYRSISARVGRDPMTVSSMWNRCVQGGNMKRRAGSQWPFITSSRETGMLIAWPKWILQPCHEPESRNGHRMQDNKCLHEQFDDVCCSMNSQFGDHECGYL